MTFHKHQQNKQGKCLKQDKFCNSSTYMVVRLSDLRSKTGFRPYIGQPDNHTGGGAGATSMPYQNALSIYSTHLCRLNSFNYIMYHLFGHSSKILFTIISFFF
jgi:hypothetical protein